MSSSHRIFAVTVITEVEFVSDASIAEENVFKHLTDVLKGAAARALSLRTVQSTRVLYCGGGVVASGEQARP